jgi:hypothetical protein
MTTKTDRFKRGSRPPYIGLSDAFRLIEDVYEQGGGRASKDLMSRVTENSSSSSSFTKKANALKSYGLVIEEGVEFVLTPDGLAIVAPTTPEGAAQAKKSAFLRIDVFSRIFERHKGKLLPADEFLKNIIEQDMAIPKELSKVWVFAVKDSLRAAGLLYDRGDGKMQIMESPLVTRTGSIGVASTLVVAPSEAPREQSVESRANTVVPFGASGHSSKIQLSNGRSAVFSIPDSLTGRDAQKIKSAISGLAAIIDSMVEDENG